MFSFLQPHFSSFNLFQLTTLLGTYEKLRLSILESGLCRMSRQHIHFTTKFDHTNPEASTVLSGFRSNADILIKLNIAKAIADGILFFESQNGVVLSPGVGKKGVIDKFYFEKIYGRKPGGIWFEMDFIPPAAPSVTDADVASVPSVGRKDLAAIASVLPASEINLEIVALEKKV